MQLMIGFLWKVRTWMCGLLQRDLHKEKRRREASFKSGEPEDNGCGMAPAEAGCLQASRAAVADATPELCHRKSLIYLASSRAASLAVRRWAGVLSSFPYSADSQEPYSGLGSANQRSPTQSM